MISLKEFGKNIKKYRQEKGLTQEQLSTLAESTPQTLSGIERGKNFPSFKLLNNIIEALEIKPYKLFVFDSDKIDDLNLNKRIKNITQRQLALIEKLIDIVIGSY